MHGQKWRDGARIRDWWFSQHKRGQGILQTLSRLQTSEYPQSSNPKWLLSVFKVLTKMQTGAGHRCYTSCTFQRYRQAELQWLRRGMLMSCPLREHCRLSRRKWLCKISSSPSWERESRRSVLGSRCLGRVIIHISAVITWYSSMSWQDNICVTSWRAHQDTCLKELANPNFDSA